MSAEDATRNESAAAIRALLARPLIRRNSNADAFRNIMVHRNHLKRWFEENLGWRLQIDLPAGIVRLHKRTSAPDPRRGLRRSGAARRPFDPLRYQLLALCCAQLLRRPHVTLGDLADGLARVTGSDASLLDFDPVRHAHRVAFVDVLVWLREAGALDTTAGDLEGFASAEKRDAVLRADSSVIPLLLSTDTPPSRVRVPAEPANVGHAQADAWVRELTREPRYGLAPTDPSQAEREQRVQWARHQALRRLLDDPAVDLAALPSAVRDYLESPSGREKVMREVAAAGLECERHADVWLAIDPTREASDTPPLFGSRLSVVQQTAGILLNALIGIDQDDVRRPLARTTSALEATFDAELRRHRKWAQGARQAGVPATCADALELLEAFGLVTRDGDEVRPRPAAGRFLVEQDTASREVEVES